MRFPFLNTGLHMRVEFIGNQFQVDGSGWFNNSPTLSLALAALLEILINYYRGEPHPETGEDRLSPFENMGYVFSVEIIELTATTVVFVAIGVLTLPDDFGVATFRIPSTTLERASLAPTTQALLNTIEAEVTA